MRAKHGIFWPFSSIFRAEKILGRWGPYKKLKFSKASNAKLVCGTAVRADQSKNKFIISVPVRSKFWGLFLHFLQFFIGDFALFSAKIVFFANISFSTSKQTTFVHVFCRKMTKKVNRIGTLIMNFIVIAFVMQWFFLCSLLGSQLRRSFDAPRKPAMIPEALYLSGRQ